jgi:transcriptional regulator with XRE-family HTH domain
MSESVKHPLLPWIEQFDPPRQARAAEKLGVSEPYLSQVLSHKRAVSLKRAAEWSKITNIPVGDFVQQPQAAE